MRTGRISHKAESPRLRKIFAGMSFNQNLRLLKAEAETRKTSIDRSIDTDNETLNNVAPVEFKWRIIYLKFDKIIVWIYARREIPL